tara:strand:+ start:206 stop:826 length:621 start_codon:yes stop_codon:yes gene_type:complete
MSFKKNKYLVIKKIISKELVDFLYHYFQNKRRATEIMFEARYLSPYNEDHGVWSDPQSPNTYSIYGDTVFDTVLEGVQEKIEKAVGHKLVPTYSYGRLYKAGDVLKHHTDRYSCEVSCTLNLGGDKKWPIYYDPKGLGKGIKITLNPGDLLLYYGKYKHWRDAFTGKICGQVFLHYNDKRDKESLRNIYDGRQYPGLPNWFKRWRQ